ncbi:MAG: L-ribulose-5-phosphate 3-epimerase [Propionibacteriaceae bacterium]|jgi:L-ribulose-5-phosphate 3-epimerase/hexulose-6-phosphate isomerase|nr:L-ribulose-5-phosphate 3-epimerase [Propionibacteriaceae bacterium]
MSALTAPAPIARSAPVAPGGDSLGRAGEGISLGIYEKALVTAPSWDAFLAQAAEAGFSFVDLSVDESPQRSARLAWSASERAHVNAAAHRQGVQLGGICLSLHRRIMPGSADPAIRRQAGQVYRSGVDLAADLGITVLQIAGYYAYYEPDDPAARDRYIDTLAEAAPYAARAGVVLGIENVDGHDIASIPDAVAVVDEIASPWVQVYPDIGNIAEHGGDAAEELRRGEGRMVALHVKDVFPGRPRRVPFGEGVADFDGAFAELRRQRWSGRIMLEMWNDDAADSLDRCVQARQFIDERLTRAGLAVIPPGPAPL